MGIKTKIQYCDSSVNPIMGCTGCALRKDHCYAAALCARYAGRKGWPRSFDQPEFFPGRLEAAIGWKDLVGKTRVGKPWLDGRPRHIFVNDMSDGFCPDVDAWGWLLPHLDAIEASPHVWLLLTKWPSRMWEFFASLGGAPDNVWLGVSVENQAAADARRRDFEATSAAVKFVSYEPALSLVDWTGWEFISQLIFGGESGPGARPAHPDWFRNARDWAGENGVARFFKQHGEWVAHDVWHQEGKPQYTRWGCMNIEGRYFHQTTTWNGIQYRPEDGREVSVYRVGKKAAGRQLDGCTWDEMPNGGNHD